MIIFKTIKIGNFRNIRRTKLEDLKDLNILIGPNNCGKTNILDFISKMSKLYCGGAFGYLCEQCQKLVDSQNIVGLYLPFTAADFYLNEPRKNMLVTFLFDEKQLNRLVPGVLEKQREKLKLKQNDVLSCEFIKDEIVMENEEVHPFLCGKHLSPFIHEDIIQEIKYSILYCPEGRLQNYKEKGFAEYVRERQLSGAQKKIWIDFLQRVVDPRIDDEKYDKLIRKVDGADFETEISEQGSGVRSLVCLAVDILFSPDKKVVLIDEPELGLNPFVKQEFLKFLLEQSQNKQIFIATQDPTFVNPVLWKNNNVSVYFYSVIKDEFCKIDLGQNQEDPNTFAGYLPHTVSLKDIHIYVEGTSDAYIFQILLEIYLKETLPRTWFEVQNKIGIYHLCGDFWEHLLYTIPRDPYKCIIILDGDKRENVKEVCQKYNKSKVNTSSFEFCEDVENVKSVLREDKQHPIYCLKEDCIEKYLFPEFNCANIPAKYRKTIEGPRKAEKLERIPEEINELFEAIFDFWKEKSIFSKS